MLNYTDLAARIVRDVTRHIPEFAMIDPARIAVLAAARCSGTSTGNLAVCYGLRREIKPTFSIWFYPGSRSVFAVSQWFRHVAPRVVLNGQDAAYMIMLRLPRLLKANPLEILIHELYHIHPNFDRTLRPERHGKFFDSEVRRMMAHYLRRRGETDLAERAQMRLPQILREHEGIIADGVPDSFKTPLIELAEPPASYEEMLPRLYPGYTLQRGYRIMPATLTADRHPRKIDESHLVLRHYSSRGIVRIPHALARYSRRGPGLSAG